MKPPERLPQRPANDATEALFAEWNAPGELGCGMHHEMKGHLAEVLRRQGIIAEGETAEFHEARLLVNLHIAASAAADPRKLSDDATKRARKRAKSLRLAQDTVCEILAEDASAPPHASVLALLPSDIHADLLKSHREFWLLMQGATSFRRRLTEKGHGKDGRWERLIGELHRIYADLGGKSNAAFRAGINAMNAALPQSARAASDEAIRKRVERMLAKSSDRTT